MLAQGTYQGPTQGITNKALSDTVQNLTGSGFLNKFLPNLIGLSMVIGVLVFMAIIILGAIQWITSGGDKTALEGAKGKITNALIGIVVLFALFAILKLLEDFFGINILEIDLGVFQIS
jgi:hypothetical protein